MRVFTASAPLSLFNRQGISWRQVSPGLVEISIDITNVTEEPVEGGELVLEAAPLGAFVPFRPLTRIAVEGLDPGEGRRTSVVVSGKALESAGFQKISRFLSETEWVGNLNVYFDRDPSQAVEVHRALNLRIPAGRGTGLSFLLAEDCRVEVCCSNPAWQVAVETIGCRTGLLRVCPGEPERRAEVVVEAKRLSDGKIVPVEFSFVSVRSRGDNLLCAQPRGSGGE